MSTPSAAIQALQSDVVETTTETPVETTQNNLAAGTLAPDALDTDASVETDTTADDAQPLPLIAFFTTAEAAQDNLTPDTLSSLEAAGTLVEIDTIPEVAPYGWLDFYSQRDLVIAFFEELPNAVLNKNESFLIEKLQALLENPRTFFRTLNQHNQSTLHAAVLANAPKALAWLLSLKPSSLALHRKDINGKTALDLAVLAGQLECIQLLMQNGATLTKDVDGKTALDLVALAGNLECVMLLILNGATFTPELLDSLHSTIVATPDTLASIAAIKEGFLVTKPQTQGLEDATVLALHLERIDCLINNLLTIPGLLPELQMNIQEHTEALNTIKRSIEQQQERQQNRGIITAKELAQLDAEITSRAAMLSAILIPAFDAKMQACHDHSLLIYEVRDYLLHQPNALEPLSAPITGPLLSVRQAHTLVPKKVFTSLLSLLDYACGNNDVDWATFSFREQRMGCNSFAYELKKSIEAPVLTPSNQIALARLIAIHTEISDDDTRNAAIAAEKIMVLLSMLLVNPHARNLALLREIVPSTRLKPANYHLMLESYKAACKDLILLLKTQAIYQEKIRALNAQNPMSRPMSEELPVFSIVKIQNLPESRGSIYCPETPIAQQALREAEQWFNAYNTSLFAALQTNRTAYYQATREQVKTQEYITYGSVLPLQTLCTRAIRNALTLSDPAKVSDAWCVLFRNELSFQKTDAPVLDNAPPVDGASAVAGTSAPDGASTSASAIQAQSTDATASENSAAVGLASTSASGTDEHGRPTGGYIGSSRP